MTCFVHKPEGFSPVYPIFEGALHNHAGILTANILPHAVAIIEFDDEPDSVHGPASRYVLACHLAQSLLAAYDHKCV